jgi:hypothetical protein
MQKMKEKEKRKRKRKSSGWRWKRRRLVVSGGATWVQKGAIAPFIFLKVFSILGY